MTACPDRQPTREISLQSVRKDLQALLSRWPLTLKEDIQPCSGGVDNYNYRVFATEGTFVATMLRTLNPERVERIIDLLRHLKRAGLPVPDTIPTTDGEGHLLHNGRPVLVQNWLPGEIVQHPTQTQCREVGALMARFHLATTDLPAFGPDRWLAHCTDLIERYAPAMPVDDRAVLSEEFNLMALDRPALPNGLLHTDFFLDNLLFDGDQCTGLFDFYCIETGEYIRDIAIALLDWAWLPDSGQFSSEHARALIEGYGQVRPLSAAETAQLPQMLRASALSIWLYRLERQHNGARLSPDRLPEDMLKRLLVLRKTPPLQ